MNKLSNILRNKKGFTLMEVIVVLIILAVLAAALIPTFLGFVQQAGQATAIAEARLGMTAAQAVITEAVGRGGSAEAAIVIADLNTGSETNANVIAFMALVGAEAEAANFSNFAIAGLAAGDFRVTDLDYNNDGWWISIREGQTLTSSANDIPPRAGSDG